MRALNDTRRTVVAERVEEAASLRARLRGLLGRDGLEPGTALLIRPCSSIQSFFMRFTFDAAFLDGRGRVLHLVERMRPFRLSRWVPRARAVLELPAGALARSGTRVGDVVRFEQ